MLTSRLLPLILLTFLPGNINVQQRQPATGIAPRLVVRHPEQLSGSWEIQGENAVYGLQIQLTTRADGAPLTLIGVQQVFQNASVELYKRTGLTRKIGDGAWLPVEPSQLLTDGHLVLKRPALPVGPEVQLDLILDPVFDTWSGRFRLRDFDRVVTLVRPHPPSPAPRSPFVGTWSHRGDGNKSCLHIVQTGGESLAGWYDTLATPGALRYANGTHPPVETFESYGSIALVQMVPPAGVVIELNTLSAGCCSINYGGRITPNGKEIQSGQSGSTILDTWTRMRGDSCVAASAEALRRRMRTNDEVRRRRKCVAPGITLKSEIDGNSISRHSTSRDQTVPAISGAAKWSTTNGSVQVLFIPHTTAARLF